MRKDLMRQPQTGHRSRGLLPLLAAILTMFCGLGSCGRGSVESAARQARGTDREPVGAGTGGNGSTSNGGSDSSGYGGGAGQSSNEASDAAGGSSAGGGSPRHRKLVMEAPRSLELAQTRATSRSLRWPPKDLTT